jgi:hypothetical protein
LVRHPIRASLIFFRLIRATRNALAAIVPRLFREMPPPTFVESPPGPAATESKSAPFQNTHAGASASAATGTRTARSEANHVWPDPPSVEGVDVELECGACGKRLRGSSGEDTLRRFAFCGCANRAHICCENRRCGSHLLGAKDPDAARVHIVAKAANATANATAGGTALLSMTLRRWTALQTEFKTRGALYGETDDPRALADKLGA